MRVVVDPRISDQDRDPVLTDLLTSRHFEVGLVGRSPDDTIQIHEPDSVGNRIPVTYGSTWTYVWPLDNLLAFAKAGAEMYGVDAGELTESLFLQSAVERWDCDFFVSDSDGLHTPGGGYRDVPVLTQEQAVPVLALLLRSRELGRIPGEKWAGGGARVHAALVVLQGGDCGVSAGDPAMAPVIRNRWTTKPGRARGRW